jgi:tetratricopeptide (TPR) repeat protein
VFKIKLLQAATLVAVFFSAAAFAQQKENFHNLIDKAHNLTLQRDRLQASQVLQRALQKEPKNSPAFKEMSKALDELMLLFYTEKGQSLFSQGDAALEKDPAAALESFQSALRVEDGNLTVLKAIARIHLRNGDCDKADGFVKQAEGVNPYSAEVRLLRLQQLDCAGATEQLSTMLANTDIDLSSVDNFVKPMQIKDALHKKDLKHAHALLSAWEQASPDQPEIFFWKWRLSSETPPVDKTAGAKYLQLCQNLSLRKRKNYGLDVELCKSKDKVDEALRATATPEPATTGGGSNG